jgi:hypothetical protein
VPEERYLDVDSLLRDLTQVEGGGAMTDSLLSAPAARMPRPSDQRMPRPSTPEPSGMMTRSMSADPSYPPSGSAPRRALVDPMAATTEGPPSTTAPSTRPSQGLEPARGRRGGFKVALLLGALVAVGAGAAFFATRRAGSIASDGDRTETASAALPSTTDGVSETAASAAPAAVRTLQITSTPPGAKVEEGTKVVCGATPCEVTWRDAEASAVHELVFSKPGFKTARLEVTAEMTTASGELVALTPLPQVQPGTSTATKPSAPPSADKPKPLSGYKDSPY